VIALLAESLDPTRGGAERAIRATARALAKKTDVRLYGPADRLGPAEPGIETVGVALKARSRAARARELASALSDEARRRGGTVVACGKILGADLLWSHGGVHAASRDASARTSRLPLPVARALRRLRPVERVFDEIERENVEAARSKRLLWVALSNRVGRDLVERHDLPFAAVVRNGVELERFSPREEHGGREVRALFCAHAFALKGLDRAIRALAFAPSAHLTVVGRGAPGRFLELARARGVAERVTWKGEVPDLAPELARADVLLHPTRYDPCSLVVLEALAASVPVITTRADGSSEVVGEGGFVLRDPDDAVEAGAWLEALADPLARERVSRAARASARSIESCAGDLLEVSSRSP
jgi:UDP-glucose:(heptosyl)LPS alpha-1,3-glucosyltransferase